MPDGATGQQVNENLAVVVAPSERGYNVRLARERALQSRVETADPY